MWLNGNIILAITHDEILTVRLSLIIRPVEGVTEEVHVTEHSLDEQVILSPSRLLVTDVLKK